MKLESTLPERTNWIFVTPGFDLIMLMLALVMLTGVVASEGLVEVKVPPSEFRGIRLGNERFVVVPVKQGSDAPVFYAGKEKIERGMLEVVIEGAAKNQKTDKVTVQCDARIGLGVEQELTDIVTRLGLRYYRVVRQAREVREEMR